ncbi:MAG: hypothetical protein HDR46_05475 [Bacteroides sp.]|nr:hypothetical protein [Bacteroides sp.]
MINPKLIILLFIGCLALAWACKPAATPDKAAAEITEALENDNIDAARERTDAFFASGVKLDTVNIQRLCMLSVTLARLSESGEPANDYAAHALQCYRVAMRRDSVAAMAFYSSLDGDDYRYVNLLHQLGGRIDARDAGIIADEEMEEIMSQPHHHNNENHD